MSMTDDIEYYLGDYTDLSSPAQIEPATQDGKMAILMLDVDGVDC